MDELIKNKITLFLISLFMKISMVYGNLTYTIGYSSTCPYACEHQNEWQGYIVDILKENFSTKKNSINIQFKNIPLSRLLISLKAKQVDFIIIPYVAAKYESSIAISEQSLGFHYLGVLSKNDKNKNYSYSSFAGKTLAIADIGNETDNLIANITNKSNPKSIIALTGNDTIKRLITMVRLNRIDYGLADYNILKNLTSKDPSMNLRESSLNGFSSINLVSLDSNEKQMKKLDNILKLWFSKTKNKIVFNKILKKYHISDWTNLEATYY